jgi:hypothetical protein
MQDGNDPCENLVHFAVQAFLDNEDLRRNDPINQPIDRPRMDGSRGPTDWLELNFAPTPEYQLPILKLEPFCLGGYFAIVAMCADKRSRISLNK